MASSTVSTGVPPPTRKWGPALYLAAVVLRVVALVALPEHVAPAAILEVALAALLVARRRAW